ncbi:MULTISPECIES: PP2C family protein-serine/threonine phosphatase [Streptomyces]|uniref:PP2C family protein-serine/threonine phosphatase n=1 Tax=Streptomyces TaxID=1883 RepID=UPI001591EFD0|nr:MULTISPECIES: PP2C family protein-serine/threonine phosphatase [Streptomyces]QKV70023.1 serine/threonine-protein phosphatase [Streptomyces harbinensis]
MYPTPRQPARGLRYVRLVPATLIFTGLALSVVTPPHLTFTPLFVAPPVLAAPVMTLRGTVYTGLAALLASALLAFTGRTVLTGQEIITFLTVLTATGLALLINRIVAQRDQWVASARGVAEIVQRAVVPEPPNRAGSLLVAARYRAAQRDTLIGGDLYAVRDTPYGVRLLVGDVRGKGLGATEMVSVILGTFREAAEYEEELGTLCTRLQAAVEREKRTRGAIDPQEEFATAVVVEVPRAPPHELRLINLGHPPPLLLPGDAPARYLEVSDPQLPLGLMELSGWTGCPQTFPFPPGAQLLLYTDGVSEARDGRGVFFDPALALDEEEFGNPQELLDRLVSDVLRYTGGRLNDDMALLAVSRATAGNPGATNR